MRYLCISKSFTMPTPVNKNGQAAIKALTDGPISDLLPATKNNQEAHQMAIKIVSTSRDCGHLTRLEMTALQRKDSEEATKLQDQLLVLAYTNKL